MTIAATNGPESVVISGDGPAVHFFPRSSRRASTRRRSSRLMPSTRTAWTRSWSPCGEPRIGGLLGPDDRPDRQPHGPQGRRHDLRGPRILEPPRPIARPIRPGDACPGGDWLRRVPGDWPRTPSCSAWAGGAFRTTARPGSRRSAADTTIGTRCWTAWPNSTSAVPGSTGPASTEATSATRRSCPPIHRSSSSSGSARSGTIRGFSRCRGPAARCCTRSWAGGSWRPSASKYSSRSWPRTGRPS